MSRIALTAQNEAKRLGHFFTLFILFTLGPRKPRVRQKVNKFGKIHLITGNSLIEHRFLYRVFCWDIESSAAAFRTHEKVRNITGKAF